MTAFHGRLLTVLVTVLAPSWAAAGVWDEMQFGNTSAIEAKILRLNMTDDFVEVAYRTRSGQENTGRLCSTAQPGQPPQALEIARTQFLLQDLREAVKSARTIRLAVRGPWSPCLIVMNSQK